MSFCSMVSSAMRRLYLRASEKTMLSLCLSEWLGWKCKRNEWVFCTVLLRVSGLLLFGSSCLGRISLGWSVKKKILIVGSRLFMKSFMDWSCLVVLRQITKMSIYESLREGDFPVKDFPDGFFVTTYKEVGVWWVALVPIAVPTIQRKCLSMNERLLFFRMVSSSSENVQKL